MRLNQILCYCHRAHLFSMKDVSVLLFPLAETLSLDCSSTVMVQEVAGGEDRSAVVLVAVALPLLLLLLVLLLVLVLVEGGGATELGSRCDLVEADLLACSSPCCMRYNTNTQQYNMQYSK